MPTAVDIPTRELAESFNRASVVVNPEWQEKIKEEVTLEKILPVRYTDNTYVEDFRKVENILQPYVGDYAPKGVFTMGSVENKLEVAQIDFSIKAADMQKFFNTRYPKYAQAGRDPQDTDFVQQFFNEFFMDEIVRELKKLSMHGQRVERVSGTAAPFLTTFTGYNKRFNDLATAGKLNEIVTGVLNPTDIVTQVQNAMGEVPSNQRWKKGVIRMSYSWAKKYSNRYKSLTPYATKDEKTKMILDVDDYNVMIEPLEEMEGLDYFVIDMQPNGESNMITVQHDTVPMFPILRFESDKRDVAVMGEMYRNYGLSRYEYTFRSKAA